MSVELFFNEFQLPSFVKVTGIEESLLPTFDDENYRSIKVKFSVRRYRMLSVEQIEEFSTWLRGNNFEYSKLVLPGRTDSYYMAIVDNSVEITDGLRSGTGIIEFKCYANRFDRCIGRVTFTTSKTISYFGTVETYPTITLDISQECQEIELSFSNARSTNHIKLVSHFNRGQKIIIDCKKKKITVDDKLNMQILTLDSYFHQLDLGQNHYRLLSGNCTISVSWRNEFLS